MIPGDPTTYPDPSEWFTEEFLGVLRRFHEADPARALRWRQARIAELVEMTVRPPSAPVTTPNRVSAIVESVRTAIDGWRFVRSVDAAEGERLRQAIVTELVEMLQPGEPHRARARG